MMQESSITSSGCMCPKQLDKSDCLKYFLVLPASARATQQSTSKSVLHTSVTCTLRPHVLYLRTATRDSARATEGATPMGLKSSDDFP